MPVMDHWAFAPDVERWAFSAAHTAVAGTGGAYFYMKYAMTTDDPFALVNHPWQPVMLAGHVFAAPFLIVVFGMVFRSHMLWKILLSSGVNRRTGWLSLLGFAAMGLSGYLIQVASSPALVTGFVWTHITTSALFTAVYSWHLVTGYRAAGRTVREPAW